MSRMIKFRGKFSKDHPWVYGDYYKYYDGSFMHVITYIDTELMQNTLCPIDEDSLGQFTGLKDKNGKEIYEGDIVTKKFWHNNPPSKRPKQKFIVANLPIVFDGGCFSTDERNIRNTEYGTTFNNWWDDVEIIGNIYENPELISNQPTRS